jgi:HK97 family phage major capsid protein
MRATDQMLARYAAEIEERQAFIDGLVEAAEKDGRDLNSNEMELVTRARERLGTLDEQIEPLQKAREIATESRSRVAALAKFMSDQEGKPKREVEYRSAGGYVVDRWRAGLGSEDALERLELFHRAASHQTTADNPGLLPEQILGPVINFIDAARPLVSALGPRQLPSGSWSRPNITQHTQVGVQSAEKAELVSRKMIIGKIPVTAKTYGGYVNVSRQDVDWTQPQVMDIVINDLAAQYAVETENAAADDFAAAATAGPVLPASPDSADVAAAIWTAVGSIYAATKGQGRVIVAASPDMLGLLGPLFPPVNPQNAQSSGFSAADYGMGAMGQISGLAVVVSAGLNAGTLLVLSTAAAEVYEDRIGALQVVEPSVLGVQVAYAGYFADIVISAAGIVKITKTP